MTRTSPTEHVHRTGAGRRQRADAWAVGVLLLVLLVLLLPALTLQAPMLYSDGSVESIPRLLAIARTVQAGAFPLWDSATFAGARPFYVTNESGIFYPPMYPLYWLANVDDLASATVVLALLPYTLHLMLAAAGAYAFSRAGLRLHPAGAFVCGLAYSLCPEMWMQVITPDGAFLFAYLPWAMLAATRLLETGWMRWWLAGCLFLALLVSVGTINFLIRIYFTAAVAVGLLWLLAWRRTGQIHLMRLLACAAMFALGLGLNGFALGGVYEGILWIQDAWTITPEMAAGIMLESSMPPLNLVTLFVPNFYGVLDAAHGWGPAISQEMTNVSALTGGISLIVAVAAALLACRGSHSAGANGVRAAGGMSGVARDWVAVALVLLVFSLLTMMGRFTPVFGWLCVVLPWFFNFPHPIYYRFVECWSLAVLAGIGVSVLVGASRDDGCTRAGWRLPAVCVAVAAVAVVIGLLWPTEWDGRRMPAFRTLSLFGEWGWFATGPLLYFLVASAALVVAFVVVPRERRGWIVAAGIVAETLVLGGLGLYEGMLFEQKRWPPELAVEVRDERYLLLDRHPHYELAEELKRIHRDEHVRFNANVSTIDNQAWALGTRALLGYSSKPLAPRFRDAADRFTTGMPYDLKWTEPPLAFFANMNVGYVVTYELELGYEVVARKDNLTLYRLPSRPLPALYFQDRVVPLERKQQLERLFDTDLRRAVYVLPDLRPPLAPLDDESARSRPQDEVVRGFDQLQAANRLLAVDRSHPNRREIHARVTRPAMLVIPEAWHLDWIATVDGREVAVHEVNYLQQGIWLEPGIRKVELRFVPASMQRGARASLASLLLIGAVLAGAGLRRVRGRRAGDARQGAGRPGP